MPSRRISKGTLSSFLRTKCDRSLFLSLHTETELKSKGMPEPLQARPGIGALKTAGVEFENERNDQLINIFGSQVIYESDLNSKPTTCALEALLAKVTVTPSFILQAKIEPSEFQAFALNNIGLTAQVALIPHIAGLIPDIIVVRDPSPEDQEVSTNGERINFNISTDTRRALSIIDVKHTSEANPSYSAEVALYAIFLANWLAYLGLNDRYFVAVKGYLWTRFKQGDSELDRLFAKTTLGQVVTHAQYYDALILDCEEANLRFYLSTVLHFFREDLPKVVRIGDASPTGWDNLEWHVDSRCSSCDWLGLEKWATNLDKVKIASNPAHYCFTASRLTGHLSQIAGLTRGASKTLRIHSISSIAGASTAASTHAAFQNHSHLKKERSRIPARALALLNNTTSTDNTAVLATLAKFPRLQVAVVVNFDPSAGLLTGLSISGRVTNFVPSQSPQRFGSTSFIVDQKELKDEWIALESFLSKFSDIITQSEAFLSASKEKLTAQIIFWERRQFEELCSAMGRHLPKVMLLTDRKTRALAWLFPADELMQKPDGAISPSIVFIDEIIHRVVFSPSPHVVTLLDTAEVYFSGYFPIRQSDAYYREFLSNGIPRERIYEIWSNQPSIPRGKNNNIPRNTIIQEFGNALDTQCKALVNITEKLRTDFRDKLITNAPELSLTIPSGARSVAFDSKLWVWWEELQFSTSKLEAHQQLALDSETLEANFEAIRLTNGQPTIVQDEYSFDVLASSTEAKLEAGDAFLAIGKEGSAGLPLRRGQEILSANAPIFHSQNSAYNQLLNPLWSSLSVTLISFDRNLKKVIIKISNWHDPDFAQYILQHSSIDLMNDIFITKGKNTFKWYEKCHNILQVVGNPSIASPDVNSGLALGQTNTATKKAKLGTDPITPLATVLWDASSAHQQSVIHPTQAQSIAAYAKLMHDLNPSQQLAVTHAAEKGLTIIWGPPGTGKTQTLAGCIHGLVYNAAQLQQPLKILVSGPTYKAVEELIGRVIHSLEQDSACSSEIFVAYSSSKLPTSFPSTGKHLQVTSFQLDHNKNNNLDYANQETIDCLASLKSTNKITLVATSTMQAYKFSDWLKGSPVGEVFDVVIIDESSQVQVTTAISPIATLKKDSRLIIAGDHLQMPPIMALEPPVGAEYLVGSIQNYLLKRSFKTPITLCPLEENYRSAEDIVAYAKTIGYRDTLTSSNPNTTLHLVQSLPSTQTGLPNGLPWSDLWRTALDPLNKVLALLHDDDLSSQSNEFEAKIVAALTWQLRYSVSSELDGRGTVTHASPKEETFWNNCVGIVTPHRAQRALVVRELKNIFPNDAQELIEGAVDTVEKFQGGQRHTIVVTFGIGDADVIMGEEAFLMQLERTNVAVSRAMAKCIVIMPMTLAGHVPQDKKALETAHAIKGYVEEFCNIETSGNITLGSKVSRAKLRYHR